MVLRIYAVSNLLTLSIGTVHCTFLLFLLTSYVDIYSAKCYLSIVPSTFGWTSFYYWLYSKTAVLARCARSKATTDCLAYLMAVGSKPLKLQLGFSLCTYQSHNTAAAWISLAEARARRSASRCLRILRSFVASEI